MPRKRYKPSADIPYHLSARCLNQEWFHLPMDEVWDIFSRHLFFIHYAFDIRIHNFVLMNNHYHMIASTPGANLAQAMNYFQRETSRLIAKQSQRKNQVFGGPYYWSLLGSNHYFQYAYKYVYRNPVDAGICRSVEEYKYSSLNGLLGANHLIIPVFEDINLFQNVEGHLGWLNRTYPNTETREAIKNALRLKEFRFPKGEGTKPNPLDLTIF